MNKVNLLSKLPAIERTHVKATMHNINGEYAEKLIEEEDNIYDVTDTKTATKKRNAGFVEKHVNINGETHEILSRKVTKKVHAFPRNGLNQPLVPLGTSRGYLMGVLVSIARSIGVQQGDPLYGILSWFQNGGCKITPHWVALPVKDVSIVDFFVKEAKSKIYYEQVKETTVEFDLEITPRDGFDTKLVQELLKRASGVGISPKRRGYFDELEFS